MKYRLIIILILITKIVSGQAPAIEWQNTIGGNDNDYLHSLQQCKDGGYILGGYSKSNISPDKTENCIGNNDYWVVKLDSPGNIIWQNTIGGSGPDYLNSIQQTFDGGYILGGHSSSGISGDKTENLIGGAYNDYWIVKVDSSGNIQWQNTIGGNNYDYLYAIWQTVDSGFVLGGYSSSDISGDKTENCIGDKDYWVVKVDKTGSIEWQNTIGGTGEDEFHSMQYTSDRGCILAGWSDSNISGDKNENSQGGLDYWVVKLDQFGNIQWQNTIGGNGDDYLHSIKQTSDGGYILGGYSNSDLSGDKTENCIGFFDYWVIKLNASGDIQWQNTIGGNSPDQLFSIKPTTDNGYILGGHSQSGISGDKTENSMGSGDFWIMKLDSSGNIAWQNTIGGNSNYDLCYSIQETSDGGYIMGGDSNSDISGDKTENSMGSIDYWVIKLFPDSSIIVSNSESIINDEIVISPNPFSDHITIQLKNSYDEINISILNSLGQTVVPSRFYSEKNNEIIDMDMLPQGIYFLYITYRDLSYSIKKLIKA
ncbi:MAG: T9SS type A sorting domain-containing protein [Bacteroidota bacterium]